MQETDSDDSSSPAAEDHVDKLDTSTFERAFAESMREAREEAGLTQRELSETLAKRGLQLDPTTIGRIEKTDSKQRRSIRLGEAAIIAQVLEIEMDSLIWQMEPAEKRLETARRMANDKMREARVELADWVESLLYVQKILEAHPELCANLVDRESAAPESPMDYLRWVEERLIRIKSTRWHNVIVPDSTVRADLQRIALSMVNDIVVESMPPHFIEPEEWLTPNDLDPTVWTAGDQRATRNFDEAIVGYARGGAKDAAPDKVLDAFIEAYQRQLDEFRAHKEDQDRVALLEQFRGLRDYVERDRSGYLLRLQTLYGARFIDAYLHFDIELRKLDLAPLRTLRGAIASQSSEPPLTEE